MIRRWFINHWPRLISRRQVIQVLDRNFQEANMQMTVRRYNTILTDLGFTLTE
jgi:hypothetical protein